VIAGQRFTLKAGASSTAGAVLAGQRVEIRDAAGEVRGRASLGSQPWQGTTALLWAEVDVAAPGVSVPSAGGIANWTANLLTEGIALAHDASASSFTLMVSAEPKHRIEITVIDKATGAAVGDAIVRLGPQRAATDAAGRAELHIADGVFDLLVWKTGYDVPAPAVEAGRVEALLVEAEALPEEDPDARWTA
jgi:hypothetical protein